MGRYALVIIETDASRRMIETDRAAHRALLEGWMAEQAQAGVLVGGEAFETEAEGPVTVRRDDDGAVTVSEEPFAPGAETLGGYVLIEAADREAAIEVARGWPTPETIEVRPLWVAAD